MSESFINQTRSASLIIRPHITEKTTALTQRGVYTFTVHKNATKSEVDKAIQELYKVNPSKVNIINIHPKATFQRGHAGTQAGMKKALVFLKEGDKIDFL